MSLPLMMVSSKEPKRRTRARSSLVKILPYANFYNFFFSVTNFFFNLKILFIFVTYRNFVCLEFLLSLFCWWLLLLVVVSVIVVATTIGNLKIWFIFPVSL